jgi:microcystin-dependent protein
MYENIIGSLLLFAGTFTPKGWAECDGALLSVQENSALFSIIGYTYGGDGETTFALPDLRGRVALGCGQGPDLANRPLGLAGGEEQVTLNTDQLPAHSHDATSTLRAAASPAVTALPGGNYLAEPAGQNLYAGASGLTALGMQSIATVTAATGQSQPHLNMMPYLSLRYIIATVGIYPSSAD